MIRWGILSTAKIATTTAIPAMINAPNCVPNAIASRSKDRAHAVADQFHIPHVFADYAALLASDKIDAVYIPLPTAHHVDWATKAAEAGKHVLCEKPISMKAEQIGSLIEASAKNGVIISEAMMVAYHPQWAKVRMLIESGAIGELEHVRAAFSYFNTDPGNMRNQLDLGGGVLRDIGCYPIATTRLATGAIANRVFASIKRDPQFGTDIFASALIGFDRFDLSMHVSSQLAWRQTASFHGDKGYIEVAAPFNAVAGIEDCVCLFKDGRQSAQQFAFPRVNQFQLQFEAFARAISSRDTSELFSLEDALENQRIIDAIYKMDNSDQWMSIT
ncbi:MAG: Gfo/Idh/MocA family oxidoreductase [Pseudomonadota bacterium]